MYVKDWVKVMSKKTLEKNDKGIGLEFKVKKNTNRSNRIGFSNNIFAVDETVYIISEAERFDLMKQIDDYESRIAELEDEVAAGSSDINVEDLENQLQEKDDMINVLKERVDSLGQELESNKSQPKIHDKDEIDKLKEELESERSQHEYWKSSFENIMDTSDELAARNEELIKENDRLKNTNDEINQTNKLLNENLIASNANFKETTQELQSNHEATEKELKETITKQQTHIDELSKKVESLIGLKEYIPPTEHYAALEELKDKINEAETELSKAMAEVDMKLKTQKSEMDVKHTEEKAQMLVAYNQQLNHYKLKYNELAKDYNHLLGDASSLSRINILVSGRHKAIVKDKEPVELEEIEVEEPTETIEYVPKDNITLI